VRRFQLLALVVTATIMDAFFFPAAAAIEAAPLDEESSQPL
jgi:hypothetical protein